MFGAFKADLADITYVILPGRRSDQGSGRSQRFGCPGAGQCDLSDQRSGQFAAEAAGLTGDAGQGYRVLSQPAVTGEQQLSPLNTPQLF